MTTLEKYNEIKTAYLSSLKTLSQSIATYDKYETVLNDFGNCLEQNFKDCEQSTEITPQMVLSRSSLWLNVFYRLQSLIKTVIISRLTTQEQVI